MPVHRVLPVTVSREIHSLGDSRHANLLDPHFFPQEGDFLVCPIELGLQPEPAVGTIGSPTAAVDGGILGQGNGVDYGRTNILLPAFGKRDLGGSWFVDMIAPLDCRGYHDTLTRSGLRRRLQGGRIGGPGQ